MNIVQKIRILYKAKGIKAFSLFILRRIFRHKPRSLSLILKIIADKKGIEIGGPSSIFSDEGMLPIYATIHHLDNCNFQNTTLWNVDLKEGESFCYHSSQKAGHQFIQDSSDLTRIETGSYDFVLSSHTLEHLANPIKGLEEWKRILTPTGYLIMLLPHKEGNFDHNRPNTKLQHLIDDFIHNTQEDDLTHLAEILQLHDLSRDPWAGSFDEFSLRSADNYQNRSLHHHVFHPTLLRELMHYLQMDVLYIDILDLTHIVLIAQKNSNPLPLRSCLS